MKRLVGVWMLGISAFLSVQPAMGAVKTHHHHHKNKQCIHDCKRAYEDCKRAHGHRCGEIRKECERGCK